MRNESVFARPNGLGENTETAVTGGGPGPSGKMKEAHQYSGRRRKKMHECCLCDKAKERRINIVGER